MFVTRRRWPATSGSVTEPGAELLRQEALVWVEDEEPQEDAGEDDVCDALGEPAPREEVGGAHRQRGDRLDEVVRVRDSPEEEERDVGYEDDEEPQEREARESEVSRVGVRGELHAPRLAPEVDDVRAPKVGEPDLELIG